MVQNDFFREKICFEVIFEFLIYPMWGKKKTKTQYDQRLKFAAKGKI